MKKLSLSLLFLCATCLCAVAQSLAPISWTAYGVTFKAPKGILIEEDTEESFVANDNKFYISIQYLDSEGVTKENFSSELKLLAEDDGVKIKKGIELFELPQFYGAFLSGVCEQESCYYSYLMTKAAGNLFFISIMYVDGQEKAAQAILKSFTMEE